MTYEIVFWFLFAVYLALSVYSFYMMEKGHRQTVKGLGMISDGLGKISQGLKKTMPS